jgi:hypothetical protein
MKSDLLFLDDFAYAPDRLARAAKGTPTTRPPVAIPHRRSRLTVYVAAAAVVLAGAGPFAMRSMDDTDQRVEVLGASVERPDEQAKAEPKVSAYGFESGDERDHAMTVKGPDGKAVMATLHLRVVRVVEDGSAMIAVSRDDVEGELLISIAPDGRVTRAKGSPSILGSTSLDAAQVLFPRAAETTSSLIEFETRG